MRTYKPFLLITVLFLFTRYASAQGESDSAKTENIPLRKNIISVYPFGLIGSSLVTGYERLVTRTNSAKIIAAFASAEHNEYYNANDLLEFYLEGQFRFYFFQEDEFLPLGGFYMAPYFLYKQIEFSNTLTTIDELNRTISSTKKETVPAFAGGYIIGFQVVTESRFILDIYLGGGLVFSDGPQSTEVDLGKLNSYKRGVESHLGFALGLNF